MTARVGQGFDVHPFDTTAGRPLVLGGVVVPNGPSLAGHSDADVVTHALADALLGAACLGDIGRLYPATEPEFAGIDSIVLLADVLRRVAAAGFRPANADCTIVAEAPALGPLVDHMAERLSAVLGAPVSVKAKRGEGLGAIGRAEGIACFSIVLLERQPPVSDASSIEGHR